MEDQKYPELNYLAARIRNKSLEMAFKAGKKGAHLGGALSLAEVFAVLYGGLLKVNPSDPENEGRDRVIVSKGHCVLSYYAALNESGFIADTELEEFETNGSLLHGHATRHLKMGIEFSGGSLGMGLSFAVGTALAAKLKKQTHRVITIIGDGECNEGIVWEAFMSATHFRLDNLTVIIDHNKLQYDGTVDAVMDMGDLKQKMEAFGFHTICVDGHSVSGLFSALSHRIPGKSLCVIANTIKGKGVSFMENNKEWHHGILTPVLYEQALSEQTIKPE